jgi:UDP-N-acetylglucosamine 1-carboxyvinyltransferase
MVSMAKDSEIFYTIIGGQPVSGKVTCLGAKNFSTKAMVAAILGNSPTILTNMPDIGDTQITSEMLTAIGANISQIEEGIFKIDPRNISSANIPFPDSGSNRIPILLLGALLHFFDEVHVPTLGGCDIGERKVNFHLNAIELFGGHVEVNSNELIATKSSKLKGTKIVLPYPSVGATETCLFLGVLANGKTVIENVAIEPEIMELITMLRSMGALIYTSSGRKIVIEGVDKLSGTKMSILGDRIEAASWACLACASNGEITVDGIRPEILGNFFSFFQRVGGGIELISEKEIKFFRKSNLMPAIIETDVYPGFSTDWQQVFAILLTQAEGVSVIHETVYENRFNYLHDLKKLGARYQLTNQCLGTPCRFADSNYEHSAIIIGKSKLHSDIENRVPDLRAGLAYIIAAAISSGTTILSGIDYIERGYGNIVPRLSDLKLDIQRNSR